MGEGNSAGVRPPTGKGFREGAGGVGPTGHRFRSLLVWSGLVWLGLVAMAHCFIYYVLRERERQTLGERDKYATVG